MLVLFEAILPFFFLEFFHVDSIGTVDDQIFRDRRFSTRLILNDCTLVLYDQLKL